MNSDMHANPKGLTITGWALTVPVVGLLCFSALGKFMGGPEFEKFFVGHFGYQPSTRIPIALAEVACIVLLLIPRTCVLGAVLLTGYMGGAMATHIRVEEAWYVQFLVGVVGWLTVYCRVPAVRRVLPIRSIGPGVQS